MSVVLITGAARRIGADIARHLHTAGHDIALHYRSSHNEALALCHALNSQRPDSCRLFQADLDSPAQLSELAQAVLQWQQRIDVLINNASTFFATNTATTTQTQWDALLNSNLRAPFFLTQALLPALQASQGCIINLIDIHASRPLPSHAVYCAAKAALATLTQAQARELAPQVRVNGIAPGAILWPPEMTDTEQQRLARQIPLQRTGSTQDIAQTAQFLIESPYITGQIISVDGGKSL